MSRTHDISAENARFTSCTRVDSESNLKRVNDSPEYAWKRTESAPNLARTPSEPSVTAVVRSRLTKEPHGDREHARLNVKAS